MPLFKGNRISNVELIRSLKLLDLGALMTLWDLAMLDNYFWILIYEFLALLCGIHACVDFILLEIKSGVLFAITLLSLLGLFDI